MTSDPEHHQSRSAIVGSLKLPGPPQPGRPEPAGDQPDPDELVPVLIELNARFPGGLAAVSEAFAALWAPYGQQGTARWLPPAATSSPALPAAPPGLAVVAPSLYQGVLSRASVQALVEEDGRTARLESRPAVIFHVWPDYTLYPQIDRSAPTVKADAAWRSYGARGRGVVWAVIDSGIDATHPHFGQLELAKDMAGTVPPDGLTTQLHQDFSYLVDPIGATAAAGSGWQSALVDDCGHGTHVAGIIAGCSPVDKADQLRVAESKDPNGGFVPRARFGVLSGMAPACELISIKVMRKNAVGSWITSSSAVIRALTYLRTEVNLSPDVLRVHGVNMSLGCGWSPDQYAAGQSPLCRAVNQLVASGVSAPAAVLGSITEPAHAQDCIAVGSTHRDAPHAFGITWTSGKGPTLDGRCKPDVVAPGEWITSAATGEIRAAAGLDVKPGNTDPDQLLTYAEQSGTSMAAPHVSGVIAAFLAARPEFIGRPQEIKDLLTSSATDLGRERYAQGAGLVDLMRMLANV
jgi:subtilisin family serine protease